MKELMFVAACAAVLPIYAGTVTSIRGDENQHSKLFEAAFDDSGNTYYWSDHQVPHKGADYVSTHTIRTHASVTTVECDSFDIQCPFWVKSVNHAINFTGPLTFSGSGGYNRIYIGNWGANGNLTLSSDVSISILTPVATPLWGYPAEDVAEANSGLQNYTLKAPKIVSPETAGVVLSENSTRKPGIATQKFTLRYEGDCSEYLGSVELRKGGILRFAGTVPGFPAQLTVHAGGTLWLERPASAIASLALEEGAVIAMDMDASTDTIASLSVESLSLPPDGRVHLKLVPKATLAKTYVLANLGTVLQVSVSTGLTPENVDVEIDKRAVLGLPRALLVATDANGVRSFAFKAFDDITLSASDASGKSSFTNNTAGARNWSDGNWPVAGKDYLVGVSKVLRTFQNATGDGLWPIDTFVGDTLTLDQGELGLKNCAVVKELFIVNSTDTGAAPSPRVTSYGAITNRLSGGRVHVYGWSLFPVPVYAGQWVGAWGLTHGGWPKVIEPRYTFVDSRLCGNGTFVAVMNNPAEDEDFQRPGYLELTADNSFFTGRMVVQSDYARSPVTNGADSVVMWLVFSQEKNLCGNNTGFNYQAIQLNRGGLWAKETVDLTDTRRGIEITGNENGAWFRSDAGKTFTVRSQVTMRKPVHKVGAGTLALGGRLSHADSSGQTAPAAGQNEFYLEEGTVKPVSTNGYNGAAFKVSPGAGLEIDLDSPDEAVRTYGLCDVWWDEPFDLSACGGRLRVKVTSKAAKRPRTSFGVVTVSEAAPDLTDCFDFELPFEDCAAVVTKTVNADSTVTYSACLRSTKGLIIYLR